MISVRYFLPVLSILVVANTALAQTQPAKLPINEMYRLWDQQYVDPQATTRYAQADRTVVINAARKDPAKRVFSNPFIPVEPVELYHPLGHFISPAHNQGFFALITGMACGKDDTLLIEGGVGAEQGGYYTDNLYARGLWRVMPSGEIMPEVVWSGVPSSRGQVRGQPRQSPPKPENLDLDIRYWDSNHKEVWIQAIKEMRALSTGLQARSHFFAEDKHGNVWAGSGDASKQSCHIFRVNKDGSETEILKNSDLCEPLYRPNEKELSPDLLVPRKLSYDASRDQMVLLTTFWGSGAGAHGIFRLTQQGEMKEVIRSFFSGRPSKPTLNEFKTRASGFEGLHVTPSGAIRFTPTPSLAGVGYGGPPYEVIDSIKNLRVLPRLGVSNPSNVKEADFSDQVMRMGANNNVESHYGFGPVCYDSKGNAFVFFKHDVRRVEPNGRVTTWVK